MIKHEKCHSSRSSRSNALRWNEPPDAQRLTPGI